MTTQRPAVERTHPPTFLMKAVNRATRRLVARGEAKDALLVPHYTGRKERHGLRRARRLPPDRRPDHGLHPQQLAPQLHRRPRHHCHPPRRAHPRPRRAADTDEVTDVYARQIAELGPTTAARRLGIRINVDRPPTLVEIRER
ncbi:hypothetical protein [Streptomyces koyangensis]|uniref:hypothetical protein n=1 Tax=Streptomyces koyangensis TaxID=188770 RepID=UPI003C2F1919